MLQPKRKRDRLMKRRRERAHRKPRPPKTETIIGAVSALGLDAAAALLGMK